MPTLEAARSWYPTDDPVHGFEHVLRVVALAERLARIEGADLEIVRAAALLHDAQPSDGQSGELTHSTAAARGAHHQTAAQFAGQVLQSEGWAEERIAAVQHAIRAHRFRDETEQPETIEAQVLFDADKLDAIGAIGAARAIAYAAQHGQPAYAEPSASFIQSGKKVPGEAHSAYHEYIFKLSKLQERMFTAAGQQLAAERHKRMAAYFAELKAEMDGNS